MSSSIAVIYYSSTGNVYRPAPPAVAGGMCLGCGAHRRAAQSPLQPPGPALRRLPQPRRQKRAIVAIAHTLALIIWHILATATPYADLGSDFYTRRTDPAKEAHRLIAKLEALGHKVTLEPAA